MSGIVGIVNLDGAPVDRRLLQRLTDAQTFRGPDAQQTWINDHGDGHIGLGHTLLKTTEDSERDHQPLSLDGAVWIVANARVDARPNLIAQLQAHGAGNLAGATDAEFILRAYHVWGEDCLEHLIGDFAFGIWDDRRQTLFCARDQMGVKCFYYAQIGSCVIFSNTLACIRQHPDVSSKLDDLAIADFLLFEMNLDESTTSFADIKRLPPAHKAVWSRCGLRKSRYWTLPIEEPVFYKRAADYTDRFRELLREAVGDRLRTPRVGILMSGGLDSPTIAAAARDLSRERSARIEFRAFTNTTPFGSDERHYAGLVAEHLGIPIEYHDWEQEFVHSDWEQIPFRSSEPVSTPTAVPISPTFWDRIGSYGRVFLQGEGPDNALSIDWQPYVSFLLRRRRYGRLFVDSCLHVLWQRHVPFWGRISRAIRQSVSETNSGPSFPDWLAPHLDTRFALRARWETFHSPPTSAHPVRPVNYALLHVPEFGALFRSEDAENTRVPTEVRYPFMDLRMLRYFLTVPAIPWCRSKYLLRRAMRGALPEAVLRRPKEGIPISLIMERIGRSELGPLRPAPGFDSYVDHHHLSNSAKDDIWALGIILRARLLNHWLQNSYRPRHNQTAEVPPDDRSPEKAERTDGEKALHQS